MRRRAVVLFKTDHLGAGEVLLKPQDVADFRAAPAIDRLVVVTDAADVPVFLGQKAKPEVLGGVGVLVFVDEDIAEPALVLGQHVLVVAEDRQDVEQEVAEVAGVQRQEAGLVLGVEFGAAAVEGARVGGGHLVGRQRAVLPVVDVACQHTGRPALVVDPGSLNELLQQTQLIVGVENGEGGFETDEFGVAAQQFHPDGVEGAKPGHAFDRLAQVRGDAGLHLARGLVGEGDGQDLVRARGAGVQKMRDPRG